MSRPNDESAGSDGGRRSPRPVVPPQAPGPDRPPTRLAATRVAVVALIGVIAVIVIALLAGEEVSGLPWAAILGVLALIGAIFALGRRRRLPPE